MYLSPHLLHLKVNIFSVVLFVVTLCFVGTFTFVGISSLIGVEVSSNLLRMYFDRFKFAASASALIRFLSLSLIRIVRYMGFVIIVGTFLLVQRYIIYSYKQKKREVIKLPLISVLDAYSLKHR